MFRRLLKIPEHSNGHAGQHCASHSSCVHRLQRRDRKIQDVCLHLHPYGRTGASSGGMQLLKMDPGLCKRLIIQVHLICDPFHAAPVDIRRRGFRGQPQNHASGAGIHVGRRRACKMRQHQKTARTGIPLFQICPLQQFVDGQAKLLSLLLRAAGKLFCAPLDQRAAGIGKGIRHISSRNHIRHNGKIPFVHPVHIRHGIIDRYETFHGSRTVHRHASVKSSRTDSRRHLIVTDRDDQGPPGQPCPLCRRRKNGACRTSGWNTYGEKSPVDPGSFQHLSAPVQRMDIKSHGSGRQRIIDLRLPGQMEDHIVLHLKDMPGRMPDRWPMLFYPHQLADTVHFMRTQPGDPGNGFRPQPLCKLPALFTSSWIRIQHGRMQRIPLTVRQDKGLSKAGDPQSADIRICFRHLSDDRIYAFHHRGNIDLMAPHRPPYRIIPVCFSKILSLFVKHRTFTAGGSNIQSCNLHPDPSKSSAECLTAPCRC